MNFADGLIKSYNRKWSYVNTFQVQLLFSDAIAEAINWTDADQKEINLNIISIDTPQISNQPVEVYIGGRWRIHNGRNEMYRFSMTFRDEDQMKYFRKFTKAYTEQKDMYFDDAKMSVFLWKDADHYNESDIKIYEFNNVLIESISQVQFNNNTEAQIAEFTVQFKCTEPKIS